MVSQGGFARFRNFKISKLIGFHMARSLKKGPNWQGATLSVRLEGWINAKLQHLPGMNNEGWRKDAGIQGCIQKIHQHYINWPLDPNYVPC